ncbi:MAG: RtcB family protein [archaeon]
MEINKKFENVWEIAKEGKMNVAVRVCASEKLLEDIKKDKTLWQAQNMAKLPGVIGVVVLPDAHQGYGACIGGVSACDLENGVVSPGEIGYDINCSVRLLRTNLNEEDLKGKEKEVLHSLFRTIPSGVGRESKIKLSDSELNDVLVKGAKWCLGKGFVTKDDVEHIEDGGCLLGANSSKVSPRAKARGRKQLGTLGAGNHFLEVQVVREIFDEDVAKVFGLEKGQICIMVHCGSRGLGHQVASDYIREMERKIGIKDLPDRELVNAPIKSDLGRDYLDAMACAANFAFANKQLITHWIREDLKHYFPKLKMEVVYDICHNIAKFEKHLVDGKQKEVLVMRKGATRSFGPGRKEVPADYRKVGQPVLIPGSMGTYSYVLVGTKKAEELTWGSTAHGAGRVLSRTAAKRSITVEQVQGELKNRNVLLEVGSMKGVVDEAPGAYKDVTEVVRVSHELGIGKMVAKLKPLGVVKG